MERTPTLPPLLPVDVLLEIVALSDVTTAVRCAATSTLLHTAILDPAFRRRGFDPARLLGVSYSSPDYGEEGVVQLHRAPRRVRIDTGLLRSFDPVSSRDGLLVLWRGGEAKQLRVCNTLTGHVTTLPHMGVLDHTFDCGIYRPALLAVGDAGRSFELLVMDAHLRVQIFSSSKDGAGECGAVRAVAPPPGRENMKEYALHTSPSVIGRTVHYLCQCRPQLLLSPTDDMFILALHADAAEAATIELPEGCLGSFKESCNLAVTADGRLSVLVADAGAIRVWALSPSPEEGWSRRVVIERRGIARQVAPPGVAAGGKVVFQGFGERSGTALLRMDMVGLVLLYLETGKAVLLHRCSERDRRAYQYQQAWLHEIDLASLLEGMKDVKGIGDEDDDDDDEDDEEDDDDEYDDD